jgi:hypothetical protein
MVAMRARQFPSETDKKVGSSISDSVLIFCQNQNIFQTLISTHALQHHSDKQTKHQTPMDII